MSLNHACSLTTYVVIRVLSCNKGPVVEPPEQPRLHVNSLPPLGREQVQARSCSVAYCGESAGLLSARRELTK